MRTAAGLLLAFGAFAIGAGVAAAVPPSNPVVRVSPSVVQQGGSATASGSGFCPGQKCGQVYVSVDGRSVGSATPTKQGTFAMTFQASFSTGGHKLSAVQATQQGTQRASSGFVVKARPTPTTTTTTRRTTTTTASRTTTASSSAMPATLPTTENSSFKPTVVLPKPTATTTTSEFIPIAGPPYDPSSGYASLMWWLVPSAVGVLLVIGVVAWRQRPGEHGL